MVERPAGSVLDVLRGPRIAAVGAAIGLMAASAGCGGTHARAISTTPKVTEAQPPGMPQEPDVLTLISRLAPGQSTDEYGVQVARYQSEPKYPKVYLWGAAAWCTTEGTEVQINATEYRRTYRDQADHKVKQEFDADLQPHYYLGLTACKPQAGGNGRNRPTPPSKPATPTPGVGGTFS